MTLNYPDVCQQSLIEPWWEEYTGIEFRPGRLVWAYLPHADQAPYTLIPIARTDDPTDHETARVKIKSFSINSIQHYFSLSINFMIWIIFQFLSVADNTI